MAAIEIITQEDLQQFRTQLLEDIKHLIISPGQQVRQWLKSADVRKMLNISNGTLQTLRINGTLRFTKVGSIFFYKNEDIVKLLEGKERKL